MVTVRLHELRVAVAGEPVSDLPGEIGPSEAELAAEDRTAYLETPTIEPTRLSGWSNRRSSTRSRSSTLNLFGLNFGLDRLVRIAHLQLGDGASRR